MPLPTNVLVFESTPALSDNWVEHWMRPDRPFTVIPKPEDSIKLELPWGRTGRFRVPARDKFNPTFFR